MTYLIPLKEVPLSELHFLRRSLKKLSIEAEGIVGFYEEGGYFPGDLVEALRVLV